MLFRSNEKISYLTKGLEDALDSAREFKELYRSTFDRGIATDDQLTSASSVKLEQADNDTNQNQNQDRELGAIQIQGLRNQSEIDSVKFKTMEAALLSLPLKYESQLAAAKQEEIAKTLLLNHELKSKLYQSNTEAAAARTLDTERAAAAAVAIAEQIGRASCRERVSSPV